MDTRDNEAAHGLQASAVKQRIDGQAGRLDAAELLASAMRNERHANNAETRYWCRQYKQIARAALLEIERLTQHIEQQDDAYSLLSLDAGRKMDELEQQLAALKAQPSAGGTE